MRRFILSLSESALGFVLYWLLPRKKIVYIISSQRSGSTLLKALLGMAPDVSHIPEFDVTRLKMNRYRWYRRIYRLSSKPILVIKRPAAPDDPLRSISLPSLPCKVIILYRAAASVVDSVERMPPHARHRGIHDREAIVEYWCTLYEAVLERFGSDENARIVEYDELVSRPKETTSDIFRWIGSRQSEGFDTYVQSGDVTWKWGTDDGGPKIRKLKVISDQDRRLPSLDSLGAASERVRRVQAKLEALHSRRKAA